MKCLDSRIDKKPTNEPSLKCSFFIKADYNLLANAANRRYRLSSLYLFVIERRQIVNELLCH